MFACLTGYKTSSLDAELAKPSQVRSTRSASTDFPASQAGSQQEIFAHSPPLFLSLSFVLPFFSFSFLLKARPARSEKDGHKTYLRPLNRPGSSPFSSDPLELFCALHSAAIQFVLTVLRSLIRPSFVFCPCSSSFLLSTLGIPDSIPPTPQRPQPTKIIRNSENRQSNDKIYVI